MLDILVGVYFLGKAYKAQQLEKERKREDEDYTNWKARLEAFHKEVRSHQWDIDDMSNGLEFLTDDDADLVSRLRARITNLTNKIHAANAAIERLEHNIRVYEGKYSTYR